MTSLTVDPFARRVGGRRTFLYRLNPLTLIAAVIPVMIALALSRQLSAPLVMLVIAVVLLAVGTRPPRWQWPLIFGGPVLFALLGSLTLGMSLAPTAAQDSPLLFSIGGFDYRLGTWLVGLTLSLRLAGIFAWAMIPAVASTGPDLIRSMVQHLRVPYRIGWTAFAALRFVPRFGHELSLIRSAHRVRGMAGGRGPLSAVRRWLGYLLPLLAGAIRHAERVALSMDARAFGAYPTRTERYLLPFRAVDAIFVVVVWAVGAITFVAAQPLLGLPLTPEMS